MSWKIGKEFSFCYGHRVWSQQLNSEYSLDSCTVCRHLHGHQGKIIVYLEGDELIDGMVTDFKHLNWFKKFLDEVLDHKFIIDLNDPLFSTLLSHTSYSEGPLNSPDNFIFHTEGYYTPKLYESAYPKHIFEMYEGYVIVDFVPTSENLSKWLLDIVNEKMKKIGVKATQITFYETPKSQSNYFI